MPRKKTPKDALIHLTSNITNKETRNAYQAVIATTRHDHDVQRYMICILDHLLKNKTATYSQLFELLKKSFKLKKPPVSRYINLLLKENEKLKKVNLQVHKAKRSEVELRYQPRIRSIVLFRREGEIDNQEIVERLQEINQENRSGEVRIREAAVITGEWDVYALIEAYGTEEISNFVVNKIDADRVIGSRIRTVTLSALRDSGWELFEV